MLLLNFVLLLEVICQVLGTRNFQPYGPKMCTGLCQCHLLCSQIVFDTINLSCKLVIGNTLNFNRQTITHDVSKKAVSSRNTDLRKMKPGKPCPPKYRGRLQTACDRKDLPEFERLFSSGLINCIDAQGRTPIMYTALYKFTEGFDFLVQKKCYLRVRDKFKRCVLHWASSTVIAKKLLDDLHADIECRDGKGETALVLAVRRGNQKVVKMLYESRANMKTLDVYNNNILHEACRRGRVEIVKFILSLKLIDIESQGKKGRTPLLCAVEKSSIKVVEFLLQQKANLAALDDDKENVFHIACRNNDKAMVKYLLSLKKVRGFKERKNRLDKTPADLTEDWAVKLLLHN